MKKFVLLLAAALLLLPLAACAKTETWETVDEEIPLTAGSCLDGAYDIVYTAPPDAVRETFGAQDGCSVCTAAGGDYEITSQVLLASSAESAVRRLSGFAPERLNIIKTSRCGLPEYQFAWYTTGDEGGRLCRTDLLMDGLYGYALTFSEREGLGTAYDSTVKDVFASLSLEPKTAAADKK
jgi:hypothetical protein